MSKPDRSLDRIAEVEWQLKLNRGRADILRASGCTNDSALQQLLYRNRRKDLMEVIYGTKSQERRAA